MGRDSKPNMYRLIKSQCDLHELQKAINAAGLKDAIETLDPITVFGPTDKAFRKFSQQTPSSTCGNLSDILLYHVVPQYLPGYKLVNDTKYATLRQGKSVRVNVYQRPIFNDVITVNGASVVEADLKAKNGILHKINQVLCPPSGTIYQIAKSTPSLSLLVAAIEKAGLVNALNDPSSSLTVFAPDNIAFQKLLTETGLTLQQLLDSPQLSAILLYHVLGQTVFSAAIKECLTYDITTLQDNYIDIFRKKKCIKIIDQLKRKAKVISKNILAENGVVHVINKVLLPFSL